MDVMGWWRASVNPAARTLMMVVTEAALFIHIKMIARIQMKVAI